MVDVIPKAWKFAKCDKMVQLLAAGYSSDAFDYIYQNSLTLEPIMPYIVSQQSIHCD